MSSLFLLNLIFSILGILLPIVITVISLSNYLEKKNNVVFYKLIIVGISFTVFYSFNIGGLIMEENKNVYKSDDSEIVSNVKKDIHIVEVIDGITYINGIMIVNKTYSLPSDYVPQNTYKDATNLNGCSNCLKVEVYNKFKLMKADALALGLNIWVQSGYRSYNLQNILYNNYVARDGQTLADRYSARPGHSEHQTGLAIDLNSITDSFQYTDEGIWVNNNAYKYGFIIRYPKDKEEITGFKYEPWHLRYVGEDLAKTLYNNGDWISLEEYFSIDSKYN